MTCYASTRRQAYFAVSPHSGMHNPNDLAQGRIQGWRLGDRPSKTYESNIFQQDFVQIRKTEFTI